MGTVGGTVGVCQFSIPPLPFGLPKKPGNCLQPLHHSLGNLCETRFLACDATTNVRFVSGHK